MLTDEDKKFCLEILKYENNVGFKMKKYAGEKVVMEGVDLADEVAREVLDAQVYDEDWALPMYNFTKRYCIDVISNSEYKKAIKLLKKFAKMQYEYCMEYTLKSIEEDRQDEIESHPKRRLYNAIFGGKK